MGKTKVLGKRNRETSAKSRADSAPKKSAPKKAAVKAPAPEKR
jgi:poly [ADP-ribose] polymerase